MGLKVHLTKTALVVRAQLSELQRKLHLLMIKIWVLYVKEAAPDEGLNCQFNHIWKHSRYLQRKFKQSQM